MLARTVKEASSSAPVRSNPEIISNVFTTLQVFQALRAHVLIKFGYGIFRQKS